MLAGAEVSSPKAETSVHLFPKPLLVPADGPGWSWLEAARCPNLLNMDRILGREGQEAPGPAKLCDPSSAAWGQGGERRHGLPRCVTGSSHTAPVVMALFSAVPGLSPPESPSLSTKGHKSKRCRVQQSPEPAREVGDI